MDVQTGLVCVGLVILSGAVLLVISMFGMKEKTYEEAIAEQRKLPEDSLLLGRSTREKSKDKKQKKQGKKVKEKVKSTKEKKSSTSESNEVKTNQKELEHAHVNFIEPEAQVLPEVNIETHMPDDKKKKKKEKMKPILVNKEEAVVVSDLNTQTEGLNHFEHTIPKDDLELCRSSSRTELHKTTAECEETERNISIEVHTSSDSADIDSKTIQKENKKQVKTDNTKEQESEVVDVVKQKLIVKDNKKKNKKNDISLLHQMADSDFNLLLKLIHKTELSHKEVQELTNVLLNKDGNNELAAHSEWMEGKQDPVVKLKKQLSEKENALTEEQARAQQWQNKVKELRNEFTTERNRLLQTCRQYEETVVVKQNEVQSLHARLQHEKQALTQKVQQLQAQVNEDNIVIRKLQEEHAQNHNALQQELLSQRQKMDMHVARLSEQHKEAENTLKSQMHAQRQEVDKINSNYNAELQNSRRMEEEVKELREKVVQGQSKVKSLESKASHFMESSTHSQELARQMEDLQRTNKELEKRLNTTLEAEEEWRFEKTRLQDEVHAFTNRVSELQTRCNKLTEDNDKLGVKLNVHGEHEKEILKLKDDNYRLANQSSAYSKLEKEAQQLREENENLAAQLTAFSERPAADGRENGDSPCTEDTKHINMQFIHQENEFQQKENVTQLKEDVIRKQSEINRLTEDIKVKDTRVNELIEDVKQHLLTIERLDKEMKEKDKLLQERAEECGIMKETIFKLKESVNKGEKDTAVALEQFKQTNLDLLSKNNEELKEKDLLLNNLRREFELLKSTHNTECVQLKTDISRLNNEIDEHKNKNNDLRQKNWKIMEALTTAEKSLDNKTKQNDERVTQVLQSERDSFKTILIRIFPDINIDEKVYEKWIEKFEGGASDFIKNNLILQQSSNNSTLTIQQLENQINQLQALVTHYKTIIDDTEGMLNKLQNHVEQEEARWKQQLDTKQREVDTLMVEKERLTANQHSCSQLQLKVKDLQTAVDAKQDENVELLTELKKLRLETNEKHNKENGTDVVASELEQAQQAREHVSSELASEQEKTRDLNKELAKLRGTLKTGEAAFKEEHNLVFKLQKELDALKAASNHSGFTDSIVSDSTNALETPKTKKKRRLVFTELFRRKKINMRRSRSLSPQTTTNTH